MKTIDIVKVLNDHLDIIHEKSFKLGIDERTLKYEFDAETEEVVEHFYECEVNEFRMDKNNILMDLIISTYSKGMKTHGPFKMTMGLKMENFTASVKRRVERMIALNDPVSAVDIFTRRLVDSSFDKAVIINKILHL